MQTADSRFFPSVPYKLSGAIIRRPSPESVISRWTRMGSHRIAVDQSLKADRRHCTTQPIEESSAPDPRRR